MRSIVPVFAPLLGIALGSATFAAQAQESAAPVKLGIEQETALRCSAAFALVANGQANGDAAALQYPPLGQRGREFFVRTSARIMDETGWTHDAVAARLGEEAKALREGDSLARIMPPCLLLLDASGL